MGSLIHSEILWVLDHYFNTPPPRGRACYPWQLSRISRLSPQTNTSISCALCPHLCAPRINFLVGHPSSNRSRPSTLNLEFFLDELSKKKVYLVNMSILSILLSPEPGCHTLTHLEDRRPRRSTPVQELPLSDTSMRPVPTHVPRRATCLHTRPTHARVTVRVGSDTKCNTPPPRGQPVTPGSSLGSLDYPHRPTLVFTAHFVLTRAHSGSTSQSVTHPQIAPGQAHLT
jgi:hypothetical protein